MNELIPLTALVNGECGLVGQLMVRADHVDRYAELGLREGARVEMIQQGSPCIVRVGGAKLCLRAAELSQVMVQMLQQPAAQANK